MNKPTKRRPDTPITPRSCMRNDAAPVSGRRSRRSCTIPPSFSPQRASKGSGRQSRRNLVFTKDQNKSLNTYEFQRYRPSKKAIEKIMCSQKKNKQLIPRAPFCRLVREVTFAVTGGVDGIKYKVTALQALQEAAESYLVGVFEDSLLCAQHAKRRTLYTKDLALAYRIRGNISINF